MTIDTPTPSGGETNTSVESAAERILGLMDASQPPTTEETPPTEAAEPTPQDGQQPTEATAEEGTSDKTDDAQKVEFETIEQLAEATGVPLETILNLKARANVDGKEDAVPISEVLKSYQLSKHVNNQSQELANQRKAFEAERDKATNDIKQQLTAVQALSQEAEQHLLAEHNAIDWTTLRATDPAEFAARKHEYNERWNAIQGRKNRALAEAYRVNQEAQQKQSDELTKLASAERAKWNEVIPEWKDPAKFEAERNEMVSYLRNMGVPDTEIANIYDARQIKLIRNAMLYEKSSHKAAIAQKKVQVLPKVIKPGTNVKEVREREKEHFGRLQKTGKLDDAAAVILQRMK